MLKESYEISIKQKNEYVSYVNINKIRLVVYMLIAYYKIKILYRRPKFILNVTEILRRLVLNL
jgi:hypothetical protein